MPLHFAVEECSKEMIELLLASGADINAESEKGWTPLHYATRRGDKEIVEMLTERGARYR